MSKIVLCENFWLIAKFWRGIFFQCGWIVFSSTSEVDLHTDLKDDHY